VSTSDPCAWLARMIASYGRVAVIRMAMFWAYFDETAVYEADNSGKKRPSRMIVGGCIAPLGKWETFSRKWRKALDDAEVTAFHGRTFYTFNDEFRWFKRNGQKDLRRHNRFRDKLADLIVEYADELIAFTSQVSIGRKGVRQSYEDAALRSLYEFTKGQSDEKDSIYIVLARHPEYSQWSILKKFEVIDWEKKLAGCGIFNPRDVLPLQAADFVLHAANTYWSGEETPDFLRLKEGCKKRNKNFRLQLLSISDVRGLLTEQLS
jgi:hypothetical protein